MLFSSLTFIYLFLPVVLLTYYVVPQKIRNLVLFIASLVFYGWGDPRHILLMLASTLIVFFIGILIEKNQDTSVSTLFMLLSNGIILCLLIFFKYNDQVLLPLGISFYSFQLISYTMDIYSKHTKAEHHIIPFTIYIALFPQLIAGPIIRYGNIRESLTYRTYSFEKAAYGCRRFILGLAKKVLLANVLGEFCIKFQLCTNPSVIFSWFYAIAVMLEIYFDFSGYSDMAIGLGSILGFHFPENFNYPFMSKSLTDFWRRWHITLGAWFRDYVYIPLGGNRCKIPRHIFNILLVWFLTGLWHGNTFNFILWGLFFGIMLLLEKYFLSNLFQKIPTVFSHLYTLFFLICSFQLFHAESLSSLLQMYRYMFSWRELPLCNSQTMYYIDSYFVPFLLALIASTNLLTSFYHRLHRNALIKKIFEFLELPVLAALLIISTAYLVDGSYHPFLYFQF